MPYPNTTAAPYVRNQIKALYQTDPQNFKAVILVGKVQTPYSGTYNYDGHIDHNGSWATDAYYGEMNEDAIWTDVDFHGPDDFYDGSRTYNVPGDGKFDPWRARLEMMVGRIDFSNLSRFAENGFSEIDLLKRYLRKNLWYRQNQMQTDQRLLISDYFVDYAWGNTARMGLAPLFKWDEIESGYDATSIQRALIQGNYEWSYLSRAGSPSGLGGAEGLNNVQPIFRSFRNQFYVPFGSYFGDWDHNDNSFFKSLIGSRRYGLVTFWGLRPSTLLSTMAMNRPLGEAFVRTAMTPMGPVHYYTNQLDGEMGSLHHAIIGDPTLRRYRLAAPTDVAVYADGAHPVVTWKPSPDAPDGYRVFHAATLDGAFTELTTSPVASTSFTATGTAPGGIYMVRASKMIASNQGTLEVLGMGAFSPNAHRNMAPYVEAPWPVLPRSDSLTVPLRATAWDDFGDPPLVSWTKLRGPGTVVLSDPTSLTPVATFSQPGYYEMQVSVSDGEFTESDIVEVRALGERFVTTGDAGTNQDQPETNYNAYQDAMNIQNGDRRMWFVKFDRGQPSTVRVKRAVLRLRTFTSNVEGGEVEVLAVPQTSWDPDDLTYNNRPATGDKVGAFQLAPGQFGQWVQADVTDYVSNHPGALAFALRSQGKNFFTTDHVNAATVAPELVVEYEISPGFVQFSQATNSTFESHGQSVELTVTRTQGADGAISVDYTTVPGTATAGLDYIATAGTLTWQHGDNSPRTIRATLREDKVVEPGETFTVRLGNYSRALAGVLAETEITISDGSTGLVLHYPFNEGSGTWVGDAAPGGNDHTTTVAGATWNVQGKFGGAYGAGTDTIVAGFKPANQTDLSFAPRTDAHTISVWIKTTTQTSFRFVFDQGTDRRIWLTDAASDGLGRNIEHWSGNTLDRFANPQNAGIRINDGAWHLLTFVNYKDGSTWKTRVYYDDGGYFREFNTGNTNTSVLLAIAMRSSNNANPWRGLLDDFRVYNRALAPADVAALHSGTFGGHPFTPYSPYEIWSGSIAWHGDTSWPADDPDQDGVSNLMEYALGTNPLAADSSGSPLPGVVNGHLTLTFQRVADPALLYQVRASNDLGTWEAQPIWSSSGSANQPGTVTVSDTQPVDTSRRRFLRLEVTLP